MQKTQQAFTSVRKLTINQYQDFAQKTDKSAVLGLDGMNFVFLGLFGEVGSLLSALKKKLRDKEGCVAYQQLVIEELGDVLWYFSSAAARINIKLSDLTASKYEHITFSDLQNTDQKFCSPEEAEEHLLALAGFIGSLVSKYSSNKIKGQEKKFAEDLEKVLKLIVVAADITGVRLEEAAIENINKTISRWASKDERVWGELYDANDREEERLPLKIRMVFKEYKTDKNSYVIQQCNEINIGDRLTDNSIEDDDYRFHDVFHLAYAAILGWSPVLRALFKVKRKSKLKIDEAQDGARAIITEEGIATWIFNHGARYNFYENIHSVDYSLLKAIQDLVKGYEVESRPLWQWEHAILEGFRVFREIRKPENRGGIVIASLEERKITFEASNNAQS